MAHRSSLYRVCGPALVGSGLLLLAAFALRPHIPGGLAAAAELGLDKWVLANWLFMLGAVALLGGWIGLTEHLNDTYVEGWSTLGLGGVIIGCTALAIASAINAEALPQVLDIYTGRNSGAATQSYLTVTMVTAPLGLMAWTILWIGTALTGLALAEDAEYPPWLGYTGLLVAVIEIALQLLSAESLLHDVFGMVGSLWIVTVGVLFTRITIARIPKVEAETITA